MARTPASVDLDDDDGDIVLVCDVCDATIVRVPPTEVADFIAMNDAHADHAREVHYE